MLGQSSKSMTFVGGTKDPIVGDAVPEEVVLDCTAVLLAPEVGVAVTVAATQLQINRYQSGRLSRFHGIDD